MKGNIVIVTGGGSNIGRGIVLAFARERSTIVNAELDEKQGQKVVDEANSLGGHAILIKTDVTDWNSVQAMVKETLEQFGGIDVLVNSVGGGLARFLFIDKPREEYEDEMNLNCWSVINCTKAVAKHMIKQKHGKIINIGSVAAQSGLAGYNAAVYGGTKGAVVSLSKVLASELGAYAINVNVVCAGLIAPESRKHVGKWSGWARWSFDHLTSDMQEDYVKQCPIRRVGRPQDVAYRHRWQ